MKEQSIRAFEQHGFEQQGETGNQVYGVCPFCQKDKHFYINIETKQWDCKSCSKAGGFQVFLKEIAEYCKEYFIRDVATALSNERGIKVKTLKAARVGYNPTTQAYTIPIMSVDGKTLWDVRMYKSGKLMTTKGCKAGLYGWEDVHGDTIWLCEGEWDALVMREILKDNNIKQTVLAVQGANTFKGEWANIFRDKIVFALYDNDDAGEQGSLKVYNTIYGITENLKFVHWAENMAEGFDVRDYYHLKKNKTLKSLTKLLEEYPPGMTKPEDNTPEYEGKGLKPEAVYKKYKKWLEFPKGDTTVLDVLFGTVIANRLIGEPLWMFIVAPSGGMKSELLTTLFESPEIFSASSITPHALISGANFGTGGDPSMIPKLNNKVFVVKDFTVILSMNIKDRDEIFAILRDAYDGRAEKAFGNGIFRAYKSKFGILAGVTSIVEQYTEEHVALGERFLKYTIPISRDLTERISMISRAMDNVTNEDTMREELDSTAQKVLDYDYGEPPILPANIKKRTLYLAQWTSILRSFVVRDKYTKEITDYASDELGTRLAKQFKKLLLGISMFRRLTEVGYDEYEIVKNIALNTIPRKTERILHKLYQCNKDKTYSETEIADMIGLPLGVTKRLVSNLFMQGVLRKERLSSIKVSWGLTPDIIKITRIAHIY